MRCPTCHETLSSSLVTVFKQKAKDLGTSVAHGKRRLFLAPEVRSSPTENVCNPMAPEKVSSLQSVLCGGKEVEVRKAKSLWCFLKWGRDKSRPGEPERTEQPRQRARGKQKTEQRVQRPVSLRAEKWTAKDLDKGHRLKVMQAK